MATASQTVDSLLDAVKQLPPSDLERFISGLSDWQESGGLHDVGESVLVRQTRLRLSVHESKRLQTLVGKSERSNLTEAELDDYRRLAERAERLNAARVQALAELARRRNQPVAEIKREVGWVEGDRGA